MRITVGVRAAPSATVCNGILHGSERGEEREEVQEQGLAAAARRHFQEQTPEPPISRILNGRNEMTCRRHERRNQVGTRRRDRANHQRYMRL